MAKAGTNNGLKGHYIICGAGRTGQVIADMLEKNGKRFVFIDRDGKSLPNGQNRSLVLGDITQEETLIRGGIMKAAGMFCVVNSDADNLVTVLMGRDLRPDMLIYARASSKQQISRIMRAGANHVISPAIACGFDLAIKMLSQDHKDGYFSERVRWSMA